MRTENEASGKRMASYSGEELLRRDLGDLLREGTLQKKIECIGLLDEVLAGLSGLEGVLEEAVVELLVDHVQPGEAEKGANPEEE